MIRLGTQVEDLFGALNPCRPQLGYGVGHKFRIGLGLGFRVRVAKSGFKLGVSDFRSVHVP